MEDVVVAEAKAPAVAPSAPKPPRTRSPNYPNFNLEESLKKADRLYEANDTHYAAWGAVASQLDYTPTSSSFAKAIGAMAQFGLIQDQGSGENRQIKVSGRYLDIKLNPPDSPQRAAALREAALAPKLHAELWEKYEHKLPPTDDAIRYYLLRERTEGTFNRAVADGFIEQLRTSLKFGGVTSDGKAAGESGGDTSKNGNDPEARPSDVREGSFVQWTSQGVHQFAAPQKVIQVQDGWAFVEGSPTGVAVSELSVVDPPVSPAGNQKPPANPFFKQPKTEDSPQAEGIALECTTLDEGPVRLEYPDDLSEESVDELQEWLIGRINRARRKAGMDKIKIQEITSATT